MRTEQISQSASEQDMSVKKKPLVVVTRKLPDSIETRMRELFDARINLDDTPLTPEQLAEATRTADVLVPTVTDEITKELLEHPDCKLKLIANFGNGVDNIDVVAAHARGITVTNTPKVLTEDTADMTMSLILAVPRRLIEGASILTDGKDWQGWSPTWMLGQAGSGASGSVSSAWAALARQWRVARELSGCRSTITTASRWRRRSPKNSVRNLLGLARPDAGAHGHHLGELSAYAGNVSSAVGAPPQADPQGRLYRQHRARRGDR
jgi:hypothetical protein